MHSVQIESEKYEYNLIPIDLTRIRNRFPCVVPDWKISHSLSERLTSLGIMGYQLMAPLKPLNTIECCGWPLIEPP